MKILRIVFFTLCWSLVVLISMYLYFRNDEGDVYSIAPTDDGILFYDIGAFSDVDSNNETVLVYYDGDEAHDDDGDFEYVYSEDDDPYSSHGSAFSFDNEDEAYDDGEFAFDNEDY